MPIRVVEIADDGNHRWALAIAACKLEDADDLLVTRIAEKVREAYGEDVIVAMAAALADANAEQETFDEQELRRILREGLPDPSAEGNKPEVLSTYRSQAAEITAKEALVKAYQFDFPVSPQQASLNANQPILGFDGWGLSGLGSTDCGLILIQVKATDHADCPPPESNKLAKECKEVPRDRSKLSRALAVMLHLSRDAGVAAAITHLLMQLGNGGIPRMTVCPVVVRGVTSCQHDDMKPVKEIAGECHPAALNGLVLSIGVDLAQFGRRVMEFARKPA